MHMMNVLLRSPSVIKIKKIYSKNMIFWPIYALKIALGLSNALNNMRVMIQD